jgi:hypothetical protein
VKNIALIGAGQLGSRHLQSLSLLDFETNIQVIDPYQNSLEVAKERLEQMPFNNKIKVEYFTEISNLSNEIDLCIVATTADIRAKIIKELVSKKHIKKLILEKVLFQNTTDLTEIDKLLEKNNIDCWVNHPFRCYPIYKELKKYFTSDSAISYQVIGGGWGLGCNGLHYIDHLAFLSDTYDLKLNTAFLDKQIIDSKRKGFIEFTGKLLGTLGNNNFVLESNTNTTPLTITIENENIKIILEEVSGWLKIAKRENSWIWEHVETKIMYFQSELTHLITKDLFNYDHCDLPTYKDAIKLHQPFLAALTNYLNLIQDNETDICPIT